MSDELMLDSAGPSPSGKGFDMKMHAGGPDTQATLLYIADCMRTALDGHNAPNYLEMEVKASDGKRYVMTLQRPGKITPHQARLNAESEVEALKAKLAECEPRTITTAEELDALDIRSVIRGKGLAEKWAEPEGDVWHIAGKALPWNTDALVRLGWLPATVLWEPK